MNKVLFRVNFNYSSELLKMNFFFLNNTFTLFYQEGPLSLIVKQGLGKTQPLERNQ